MRRSLREPTVVDGPSLLKTSRLHYREKRGNTVPKKNDDIMISQLTRRIFTYIVVAPLCLSLLVGCGGTSSNSDNDDRSRLPPRVIVRPVFLVPSDASLPETDAPSRIMQYLSWAQDWYRSRLYNQDTFQIASGDPLVLRSALRVRDFQSMSDDGAEEAVAELLAHDGYDRFNCPYIYVVLFCGTGTNPAGSARPVNGGTNNGGGIVLLAHENLMRNGNFGSTLRHELGHSFGLPHVDAYGYPMSTNPSLMSYNRSHWTDFFVESSTPQSIIPEDLRGLSQNKRVFQNLSLTNSQIAPAGYTMQPQVTFGPMSIRGQNNF